MLLFNFFIHDTNFSANLNLMSTITVSLEIMILTYRRLNILKDIVLAATLSFKHKSGSPWHHENNDVTLATNNFVNLKRYLLELWAIYSTNLA